MSLLVSFLFHHARNFYCNKQEITPCLLIDLVLSKYASRATLFSYPARLFWSACLLGTSPAISYRRKKIHFLPFHRIPMAEQRGKQKMTSQTWAQIVYVD
jgi:hypothetical protein